MGSAPLKVLPVNSQGQPQQQMPVKTASDLFQMKNTEAVMNLTQEKVL